ncbi:hypothetical protein BDZ91DRAFT_444978 [Kalaharituber pfeilii]|nr:hypothetical protein BDZ91DRAFT_444978 [Kalaharituber pfeilii]
MGVRDKLRCPSRCKPEFWTHYFCIERKRDRYTSKLLLHRWSLLHQAYFYVSSLTNTPNKHRTHRTVKPLTAYYTAILITAVRLADEDVPHFARYHECSVASCGLVPRRSGQPPDTPARYKLNLVGPWNLGNLARLG